MRISLAAALGCAAVAAAGCGGGSSSSTTGATGASGASGATGTTATTGIQTCLQNAGYTDITQPKHLNESGGPIQAQLTVNLPSGNPVTIGITGDPAAAAKFAKGLPVGIAQGTVVVGAFSKDIPAADLAKIKACAFG
jgi:hypothetical protein